jgi:hypothetical protein
MALVKYNNNSISNVTTTALAEGSLVPIKTLTASSSSTLSFVDGSNGVVLDNTYPIYRFEFINIHPSAQANFEFNFSTDSGSNYNVTKTTTYFRSYHNESGDTTTLEYEAGFDLAQSTNFQKITTNTGTDNDANTSGLLTLFNPSSTTFVKHFIARTNNYFENVYSVDSFIAGYGNTTSSIDAIQFRFSSGNIDSGKIKLYGIKDS